MEKTLAAAGLVFDEAINALTKAKKVVESCHFIDSVQMLCTGRIWTSGMGKAGLIAKKFSATLASIGMPAAFIHAGEALHGDFGALKSGDTLVVFSNSGKTDEVCAVVEKAVNNNISIILITGNEESKLAEYSDAVICYGETKEACPLGLTPTTSTTVMMVVSDALAMSIQNMVGLTYDDFARNHHGGYLGEQSRMKSKT